MVADYVLRRGDLRDELKAAAREQVASVVVLGRPAGGASFFVLSSGAPAEAASSGGRQAALESLRAFAAEIEAETGVETRIV